MNAPTAIDHDELTGLVLAGGRGSRMGGVDKGLQVFRGAPLAMHALMRLTPQVGHAMINANRNLAAYESMGAPVWPDTENDFPGPLAGFLVGLERAETPWLVTVPCDTPDFPTDLVQRLAAAALRDSADIATASVADATGQLKAQPVFSLMKTSLMEDLMRYIREGGRKIDRWTARHRVVEVGFDDASAFFNINTLGELHAAQSSSRPS